ncbi:MAG: hypothetical protein ACI87E_004425, partial [Mariniblastus sp.]
ESRLSFTEEIRMGSKVFCETSLWLQIAGLPTFA